MLGNIYVNNEGNLDVAAFYYEKCLEHHPKDASKSVMETMFARIPKQTLARYHAGIYAEIKNLYGKLSKEKKH